MLEILILATLATLLTRRLWVTAMVPPAATGTVVADPTLGHWRAVVRVGGKETMLPYPTAMCEADVARALLKAAVDPRAILAIVPPGSPIPEGRKTRG